MKQTILSESIDPILDQQVQSHPYPLLFATISGAHLYGFPSPDSDIDLRGVHRLPLANILGLEPKQETIDRSEIRSGLEVDLVTHDVRKFFKLLLKKNGYVLEQLLSPLIVQTSPWHRELCDLSPLLLTRHHSHHYLGFARTQWELFLKKPRVKPLLYVLRVLLTGIHLMQTGRIEANLVTLNQEFQLPYIDELIEIKLTGPEQGELATSRLDLYEAEYERLSEALKTASDHSPLPEVTSATATVNDLLVRIRLSEK